MRNNKKGFTLTELLGGIVILVIVILIAVSTISGIRKNILQKQYENEIDYIQTKAAKYAEDTGITYVNVETLIKEGYLDPDDTTDIYNPKDGTSLNCYYVNISYQDGNYTGNFDEKANLKDEAGNCKTVGVTGDIDIQTCNVDGTGCKKLDNKAWSSDNVMLKVVDKNGHELQNVREYSWYNNVGFSSNEATIITNVEDGQASMTTYQISVSYSSAEKQDVKSQARGTARVDKQSPSINKLDMDKRDKWTNVDKKITISMTDYSGSGVAGVYVGDAEECTKDLSYTPIPENQTKYEVDSGTDKVIKHICIMDKVGNVGGAADGRSYEVDIETVDIDPPECGIAVTSGTLGKNGWYTTNITLGLSTEDTGGSGVDGYDITTSTRASYGNHNGATQNNTNGTTYKGYVKDLAGNTSECSLRVYVDTTPPVCNITPSGTLGDNNWYTSKVTMTLGTTETGSGIMNKGITKDSKVTYNGASSQTESGNGTYTYYGYVEDKAGNTGDCNKQVKIDQIKPQCRVLVTSGTLGGDSWYITPVTVGLTATDEGTSGVAGYDLTTSSKASYNNRNTASQNSTGTVTHKGYVKDNAGNKNDCDLDVKVDVTNPVVNSVSVSSADNRYNSINVNVTVRGSDTGSGVAAYCVTTYNNVSTCNWMSSTSSTYTTSLKLTDSEGSGRSHVIYAFVKDKSGRISSASSRGYTLYTVCTNQTVTSYGSYGSCSASCGNGTKSRSVTYSDSYLGTYCKTGTDSTSCYAGACCSGCDCTNSCYTPSYSYTPSGSSGNNSSSKSGSSCTGSCYMSNNAANWYDVKNSNLNDAAKSAIQNALHSDSDRYSTTSGYNYNYSSSSGGWSDSSGNSVNTSGSSKPSSSNAGTSSFTSSNGATYTYHENGGGSSSYVSVTTSRGTSYYDADGTCAQNC